MPEISKPDFQYVWASGGAIVAPSNVKIQTGWTAEVPPFQWENWSQNRQDQAIAHILQHGISVWDAVTEYQAGKSYVTASNGKVYVAITTNTNNNPTTDTTEINWADLFKPGFVVLTTNTSWVVPPILKLGIKRLYVEVYGGGGGGALRATSPGAAGGGQGGIAYKLVDLTGVSSVAVTIGAGGGGSTVDGNTAPSGGTSNFGAFVSATGGSGGTAGAGALASPGGSGVGGDYNIQGGAGGPGLQSASSGIFGGTGGGGSSPPAASGAPATLPGHGGGGRAITPGQDGKAGIIIVRW